MLDPALILLDEQNERSGLVVSDHGAVLKGGRIAK